MASISSFFMSNITSFRNPNGPEEQWTRTWPRQPANLLKVAIAEVGYIAVIPFAIVEAALSSIAKLFSSCLPISEQGHEFMSNWQKSSSFAIAWATCDSIINVFCNDLIVHEKVAIACAASGNYFRVPLEALEPIANSTAHGNSSL